MAKLAIFGGTGKTGQLLVDEALGHGHVVTLLARTPSKVSTQDPRLHVIQGDARDISCVESVIAEADAVISVLGPSKNQEPFTVSHATKNILSAMRKHGVKRLVVSAGAGVGDPQDRPGFVHKIINLILKTTARSAYEDMLQTAEIVRASDLDWTLVRVPMLTDDPKTGQVLTGYLGRGAGMRLSRGDMADFMLAQAASAEYLHQAPVISGPK